MKYAFFIGCTIPARLKQYEVSARSILEKLNIELVDIPDFNCCGYPIRNYDYNSFLLSSARNIALAIKHNLHIITLCKCCYGSLKKAEHLIREDADVNRDIIGLLKKERLHLDGDMEVKHLLSVLYHDVGIEALKEKITRPYKEIKIATHYGRKAWHP
ncbi:MAG: heterodisulfide reductase-related iron-sulfur binding cluster [Spirochaetota bacterium]|nr:heterodisulfide reductase-related iron-sulfur binding cluster [Spirochaetota bacterium]